MDHPLFQLLGFPDEFERALNPSAQKYASDTKAMYSTAVDVKESPTSYVFVADMPGLKSSDVKVELDNHNVLAISGVRKREEHVPGVKYIRMERSAGTFMRKYTLPADADLEGIKAACEHGVLTITVPKLPPPEPAKPKTIEVTVG